MIPNKINPQFKVIMVDKRKYWKVMESIKYVFFLDHSAADENNKALIYCSKTHTIQFSGAFALDMTINHLSEQNYLKISPTFKKLIQ